ncbi:Os09g0278401 [Oryza sativa Japonica Group]|uniref:Os09g0278401 protein n=1 Tax=Oryza sativa subsp. japonica TaxID=39947 RepID=A0A0P0XKP0_ORYSJ|nr:hypothetical protein EE612_046523 [Oryza sativa]BAT07206.1 Os09g0278401 [Oryza sativa Japonica Group]
MKYRQSLMGNKSSEDRRIVSHIYTEQCICSSKLAFHYSNKIQDADLLRQKEKNHKTQMLIPRMITRTHFLIGYDLVLKNHLEIKLQMAQEYLRSS